MPVVAGAIVPHAPLLLPELESPEVADSAALVRKAVASLSLDADVVVILSPHAGRRGVYRETSGDLSEFGVPDVEIDAASDDAVRAALKLPVIEGPLDHGVVVPLGLRDWGMPVVAVGVDDGAPVELDIDRRVALVASVNLSAGLTPRAPLTRVPGAAEAEEDFVAALQRDVGSASVASLPGSCGAEIMRVFARTFRGRRARVLAHEAPVGVGYLVAEVV